MPTYHPVYQTWHTVRPRASNAPVEAAPTITAVELRTQAQHARIERHFPIADLAAKVACSPETLAGFERGDEVLTPEQMRSLRRVLGL